MKILIVCCTSIIMRFVNNMRGVGMWQADALDYGNSTQAKKMRQQMWERCPIIHFLISIKDVFNLSTEGRKKLHGLMLD